MWVGEQTEQLRAGLECAFQHPCVVFTTAYNSSPREIQYLWPSQASILMYTNIIKYNKP